MRIFIPEYILQRLNIIFLEIFFTALSSTKYCTTQNEAAKYFLCSVVLYFSGFMKYVVMKYALRISCVKLKTSTESSGVNCASLCSEPHCR
jgi:hypothetical protein